MHKMSMLERKLKGGFPIRSIAQVEKKNKKRSKPETSDTGVLDRVWGRALNPEVCLGSPLLVTLECHGHTEG